ncbi:hypothetical protein EVAR_28269_1 [Eumeta japonica]|uniref:Uncharacterized protein n=1 Tax=Eumeta variegata TaxID=151549 RepID=A0A4C1V7Z3_EUMVA|nr:hypothetical protein EVAR_28269_1 [Eumeta japonica]
MSFVAAAHRRRFLRSNRIITATAGGGRCEPFRGTLICAFTNQVSLAFGGVSKEILINKPRPVTYFHCFGRKRRLRRARRETSTAMALSSAQHVSKAVDDRRRHDDRIQNSWALVIMRMVRMNRLELKNLAEFAGGQDLNLVRSDFKVARLTGRSQLRAKQKNGNV